MKVPFVDLSFSTQHIKERYLRELDAFLDRANFILTKEVEEFEQKWASVVGREHCVGVSSGADALYMALAVLGIENGDEVIIQGNAYNACVTAILRTGAVPVFVDCDPETHTIDLGKISQAITPKTKAIMPVHLYGQTCDMKRLTEIAREHGLKVVEDCAQAHGASFDGVSAGTWGDIAAFSFYPTKNLGAFGDAGAVLTNDAEVRDRLRALRNLGQVKKNVHQYVGTNMRLDPVQAIALTLKLEYLKEETDYRQKAAEYYRDRIAAEKLSIKPIGRVPNATHVYHLFVVEVIDHDRDALQAALAEQGIGTAVHYPVPVYRQPFYTGSMPSCPVSDRIADVVLSLPLYYGITREQQDAVIEAVFESLKEARAF